MIWLPLPLDARETIRATTHKRRDPLSGLRITAVARTWFPSVLSAVARNVLNKPFVPRSSYLPILAVVRDLGSTLPKPPDPPERAGLLFRLRIRFLHNRMKPLGFFGRPDLEDLSDQIARRSEGSGVLRLPAGRRAAV